jgi:hypothetical protein
MYSVVQEVVSWGERSFAATYWPANAATPTFSPLVMFLVAEVTKRGRVKAAAGFLWPSTNCNSNEVRSFSIRCYMRPSLQRIHILDALSEVILQPLTIAVS